MAAFNFHRRQTRRWWYIGTTFVVAAFFAVFFVTSSVALNFSPSLFEAGDGNMVLDTSGNTDWNCFQTLTGFHSANYGPGAGGTTFTAGDCKATTGATNNSSPNPKFEQTPGEKFDTACPTFKVGNNPPKDVWSDVGQYVESASNGDVFFYGASIRPVVNGNSSGNIYFSQGTNPNGANCRTKGDVLLTFDFLGGGTKPTLHVLTWQVGSGSCYVGSDSTTTGCWGPSSPPTLSGSNANSDGETNASQIDGADNALNGQNVLANGFSEIGVNLTQAIKAAGGTTTCFANETWVSRSSGSSFTSSPEMVVQDQQPTCGTITVIKHTLDGAGSRPGINQAFNYTGTGPAPMVSSFQLNDKDGTDTVNNLPDTNNTEVVKLLPPGAYSVSETLDSNGAPAANFVLKSLSCTPAGNGTSETNGGTFGQTANITLSISGSVVCTYTNQQQLGAIKIVKTSSKGGALNGAVFTITGPNSYSQQVTTAGSGTACVSGLPFGDYTVTETTPPTGYSIDPNSPFDANVQKFGDCSGNGTPVEVDAVDTPLTTLEVIATSETTNHATKSKISCTHVVNGSATTVGTSITSFVDPADWKTQHLAPDTYTCTVIVDP
jgi:hypothetical protein